MKTFRDLKVWQKAHKLTLEIYKVTAAFPKREEFGLVSQTRRAMVSVPANITEGFKRRSTKEFKQFLNIALASLEEVKYYIILSSDLEYITQADYQKLWNLVDEIGKMLYSFHKKLNSES